jgi:peptidyl-tRNA hydrolase, PTH1 family
LDIAVKLIVGLGNPGPKYEHSRHNAGADFVAELARKYNVNLQLQAKFFGATARLSIDGHDTRLLIPDTFMNLSGQAVGAMAGFYDIPAAEILVAHDELDLDPGISRLKKGGGHGGHNGLKDIIRALANNRDFARLRIGIGHPGHAGDVVDYVLRRAPQNEQSLIQTSIGDALDVLPLAVAGRWNDAMKQLHSNKV